MKPGDVFVDPYVGWPWRSGRKVGRTVYAHPPGATAGDVEYDGVLIGLFDSTELAARAVHDHNLTIGA